MSTHLIKKGCLYRIEETNLPNLIKICLVKPLKHRNFYNGGGNVAGDFHREGLLVVFLAFIFLKNYIFKLFIPIFTIYI